MSQATCRRCGTQLEDLDVFCGGCGLPRAAAVSGDIASAEPTGSWSPTPEMATVVPEAASNGPAPAPRADPVMAPPPSPGPVAAPQIRSPGAAVVPVGFFSHDTTVPPDAAIMSNATRYLCAAAYLSSSFANDVIGELVAGHRAVAPSRGINLEPVIRHCLKARQMQLSRDLLLSILLVAGLILATIPLILILVVAFFLSSLPSPDWERRSERKATGVRVGVVVIVGLFAAVIVGYLLLQAITSSLAGTFGSASGLPLPSLLGTGPLVLAGLLLLFLVVAVLVNYGVTRNRTLVEWLSPGADAPQFAEQSRRVENRIAEVCRAQYGNLTLYEVEDPFIGTGITPFNVVRDDERVWSIAIELNRRGGARRHGLLESRPSDDVRVDPVRLHQALRERLLALNDPELPANEQVRGLTVDDAVVGEGRFHWDSPLIDRDRMVPYSQASPEAIDALIRNPQARLRYYQRVSISDEGQTVLSGPRPVIGSVDQEVIISAFVYVAVEGHMFYLQFVPASLAPIAAAYHKPDRMPRRSSGKFMTKVLLEAGSSAFPDIVGAPGRAWRAWRLRRKEDKQFAEELTYARDYTYADVGARVSVRELGSALRPRTYIQRLDASKYTKIIERLVIETALDYLEASNVDTTAYRARAEAIYNSGTIIAGNNGGNFNINTGSGSATQRTH